MHSRSLLFRGLFVSALLAFTGWLQPTQAAPSGLNNIPTADTAPHLTLVPQEYSTFGAGQTPDHTAGFKFGIDPWEQSEWRHRFEVGLDSHFAPGTPFRIAILDTIPKPTDNTA